MDDAKDAEFACKTEDAVKDEEPDSDSYFGLESPSRAISPDLEFVGEFTPFEDLSRKVAENYKSNLTRRSGGDHQRKFFKGKASKVVAEDAVDVEKVLKLISDKSVCFETTKSNCKSAVKTYGNRRKSSFGHSVESFGLPDDPIIASTIPNDSSSICIDLQDDGNENWVVDEFKVEKLEIKDEPDGENRLACGVYNPFYREKLYSENQNEYHTSAGSRVQNSVNFTSMPTSSQINQSKMIKIDYCKPNPKKTVIQPVEVLNIRPQPMLTDVTPVNTEVKLLRSDVKSQPKSLKSEPAEVTIELFVTEKKSERLTPVLEITPANSVHNVAEATKSVIALKTSLKNQSARNVKIDDDVIEVIDLVKMAPKEEQEESKMLNQLSLQPDVTIEIEPNKASLQSEEAKIVKSDIDSLTKPYHARPTSRIEKAEFPVRTAELESTKVFGQLETINLTEEPRKPATSTKVSRQVETINLTEEAPKPDKPVKSKETVKRGTAKTELEIIQNETESVAQELDSILLSLKEEKLKAHIELEANKPDLVKDQSEIVKTGIARTKSKRSNAINSQPGVVAPKLDSDTTSNVKVEDTPEVKLQQSKSCEAAIVVSPSKSKTRSAKPVLEISPQSPKSVETKSSRRSRSVTKPQPEVVALKREARTKSPMKQEHAGKSEVRLQQCKSSEPVEGSSIIRSSKKRLRNSEPVFDIPPKFSVDITEPESKTSENVESTSTETKSCSSKPVLETSPESSKIVVSAVVETKSRRSRWVKSQLEVVAPKHEDLAKSAVKVEHADTPEVMLEEPTSSARLSTVHNTKRKARNSEPVIDILPSFPGIGKTDGAETKSRSSRSVKSQPEVVTPKQEARNTKSPVKVERAGTLEVNLEESKSTVKPSTSRGTKRKLRNSEPILDIPPQPLVETNVVETKGRRSRSVKCQPEVVTPKLGVSASPVKGELEPEVRLDESKSSEPSKNKLRNSEPVVDIPPQSSIADAAETKGRRSRSVKLQPEVAAPKLETRTTSPVKEELKPEVRLDESKSSEPSAVRISKKKLRNSEPVVEIPPQSSITDAAETKGRRSRSVKLQPEVASPKLETRTTSPVKKELEPEVRLDESKSSEPSAVRTSKKKLRNSEPVVEIPPQSSITDAAETKGRRSRSVKFQPEVVATKLEARTKSPVKEEKGSEVRFEESKSSHEPSTVRTSKKKPRNSEPVLDIPAQAPITDAAETRGSRSRSMKCQPEVAVPEARTMSHVKEKVEPEVGLEESKSSVRSIEKKPRNSGAVLDIPSQSHMTDAAETFIETKSRRTSPRRTSPRKTARSLKSQPKVVTPECDTKSPVKKYQADTLEAGNSQDVKSSQELSTQSVLGVTPVPPKAESDAPIVTKKETVDLVSKKLKKRNVKIDDDVVEFIDLVEDDSDTPKKSDRRSVILNHQTSVAQKKERLKEILVRESSSDQLKKLMQTDEPVPAPTKDQETLKIEEGNGMRRLSVRVEKLKDKGILDSSPVVKKSRGRPRLSELKKASTNSHLDSSIENESLKTEESDLLSDTGKKIEEHIPVKRKRGRPKLSLERKLARERNQTIDLSIKSEDDSSTLDQMIKDVDNSCSGKGLESKNEAVQDTDKNKNDQSESAVVTEPKQSLPSADISPKEKRTSGTFSAWKIRLKDVETESSGLAQGSVDVDELPLSVWLESDNVGASDKDDSMKKSKRRSKKDHKHEIKRKLSQSERDVSAELSKRKPKSDIEFLDARKIPIVNQEDLDTLRLDAKNVSRSDQGIKKRNRMHINPANIKHKMLMNMELMVILKPLNETQLAQSTPKKSSAKAVDSPATKKLVPNPVNASQYRHNEKFSKKLSPAGKLEGSTNKPVSTEVDTGDFEAGDIVWAKLGSYPFWPCMITKHPQTNRHKNYLGKLKSRQQYHVRFFGDNGQRAWVSKHCVMAYHERDDLEKLAQKLQHEMSCVKRGKSSKMKINVVSSKMSLKWHSGVNEAESLKNKSLQERLAHCFVARKKKKSPNSDSWSDDEGKGSRKRKLSAEFVAVKKPRLKSPGNQLDDRTVEEEPFGNQTPENAAAAMTRRTFRGTTRRDSLARSSTDDLAKESFAPNSSITTAARNKHLVVEGSNASDTDSKLSDISSVPTSLESQAALFKRNHLFRGVSKDKVCQICEKPGNVVTCSGLCGGIYHRDCAADVSISAANATSTTEETEDDDENSDKREQLSDDAKVEILTVMSKVDDSVVDLRSTPGLNSMTLAEKIDYRMRQIMKKFDYGASYTCGSPATDPGENCASVTASPPSAKLKREGTKSISSPVNLKAKPKEDMMQIIKHVTADNVSYKCIKKKIPNRSKSAEVVVDSCSSTAATTTTTTTTTSTEFKCKLCTNGILPFCHACDQETSKNGSAFRQRCSLPKCGRYYHPECLKLWPQTQWSIINTTQEKDETYSTFVCPAHVCHTCFSEDPRPGMQRCISKAAKCVRCPVTYHSLNHCVPAGTQLLSSSQIVCPRHYVSQPHPCNANWCFICSKGGDLICCERCPTSVHAECMPAGPAHPAAADVYYCEDCQSGRLPLYDEIVWVKMGKFRWWPAVILFPNEVPESVRKSKHEAGEFVAKFFGTYNHFWVHRGNVFLFQEGDKGGNSCSSRSGLDTNFNKAIEEAATAHQLKRQFKMNHLAGKRSHLKPPPYIKIKSNKPLKNVRMVDHNISNTTACECDPSQPHPCGPDSDCLNRLLLTECNPEVCPAGERCNNQCFEKREYPPLAPNKTESRGWGLKTLAPLRKGQFVIEYVGEILDMDEYRRRVKQMHERKEENYYFLTIDNMRMLDAGPKGNLARFMNHSCQPNCETQKWTVNSDTRVGLFAKTDIPVDTELTFNYNLECIGKEKKECNCGAAKCSGFIGVKVKGEVKVSSKKRLGKKKKVEIPDVILQPCFECKKMDGKVGACNNKMCTKFYHLECAGLTSWPKGDKWVCSWHNCNFCLKRTIRCCIECTNSYCPPHAEGNVRYDKLLGFICKEHDPLKSKLNSQKVTVLNGAKTTKKEKLTAPDQATVMPSRRSLPTRDKKKKLDPSSILNFADNFVTSTPVKRLRDESTCSASGAIEDCSALKKRKTEALTTNASLSNITTRKMARELNQTVPKVDFSAVEKRLRFKHENTL